ncbi:transcriptional regulator [Streptomyces carminius]|uniref:Transcriptional regulator n=1 Tax=Streptomyces carminius TaxID=2665496 RepID=A0A2M8M5I4_9ACTN|nr:MarR family transcriptional regulator [Streptomyces carminius]PJE99482.1 transcriptional regulator [Streptomyces carminius]
MAFQLLLAEFNQQLAEAGYADLRPIHGLTFQALGRRGATSSELAERLGVSKQAAGQIVDDLERRGYLRREPHPAGGRRKLVTPTDRAQEHLAVAGRVLHRLEAELADRMGARGEELTAMRGYLARLIREMAPEGPPPLRPVW